MANYSLGEAVLGTSVDLKGLKRGMSQSEEESRSGWQRIGKIAENALGFMTGALMTRGFDAVIGFARDLGDTLINEAPRVEALRLSFENLAESAGLSGDAVLQSLREASNYMIEDADLMESYNNALLLVGESMADKFPDLLGIAQASAAATGEDVNFMLDSLVKGIGRASPMILDNLGLTINLSETYADYAESLGIAADAMSDAEKQEALLNAVIDAGGEFTARLGDNTSDSATSIAQLKTAFENAKLGIASAFLPALEMIVNPLADLATRYMPDLIAASERVSEWLGVNLPRAVDGLRALFEGDITGAIANFGAIIKDSFGEDALAGFLEFARNAQAFAEEHGPALMGAFAAVAAKIAAPMVIGAITSALGTIGGALAALTGPVALGIAAAALLGAAWGSNWLGIQDITAQAVSIITGFFQNTLLPALRSIWQFLSSDMMPIWQALGDLLGAAVTLAITALTGIWENVLLPAMKDVAGFIENTLGPVFEWLKSNVIDPVVGSFDGLGGAIENVAGFLSDLTSGLENVSLPDWMTPGSPTPWEMGLRGVADALSAISKADLPKLRVGMEALEPPNLVAGARGATRPASMSALAGAGGRGGAGGININVILENVEVNDDRDLRDLARQIAEMIGDELLQRDLTRGLAGV